VINFRFHLISLVAVFLALGVGVAMGASFIDRATVESLRGRVDALDDGYRRRGAELDATRTQLGLSDSQSAALAGERSVALAARLTDVPVVVIATASVNDDALDALGTSLGASGATAAGTLRLGPSLAKLSAADLATVRARFGLRGDAATVRSRLATDLGVALAFLSAAAPPPSVGDTTTTSTTVASSDVVVSPTNADQARAYIAALSDLGVVRISDTDEAAGNAFPAGTGYRYVLVAGSDDAPGDIVAPLTIAEADRSPRTMTVGESRAPRPSGEATTTTVDQPKRGSLVAPLREGDVADAVSTVDDLEESFGRIAVVYAIAEQRDNGRVGHYGTGDGATAPFPTVPGS